VKPYARRPLRIEMLELLVVGALVVALLR